VRTDFILDAAARRVPGGVRLDLEPTISSIAGYVEGAPIVNESCVTASVVADDGDWIVLSGLRTDEASNERAGLPGGLGSRLTSDQERRAASSRLLLLVRAERV
jgi:type II secretory pathway component GspD/PulD (secretin)